MIKKLLISKKIFYFIFYKFPLFCNFEILKVKSKFYSTDSIFNYSLSYHFHGVYINQQQKGLSDWNFQPNILKRFFTFVEYLTVLIKSLSKVTQKVAIILKIIIQLFLRFELYLKYPNESELHIPP